MKYSAVIAVFLGYAKADAPPAFNEPPFAVKTHPSAAGLVQVESACAQFGVAGVTCDPANNMLFATGMNGDEDLGEDITMKGQKFHFNQQPQPIGALMQMQGDGEAAAIHKADWTGYTFPDKVHTLDPKIAKTHTAFYAQRD